MGSVADIVFNFVRSLKKRQVRGLCLPVSEDIKVLCNRLFGYSTVNNNSEGAILSWIAGADTGERTPGGWGTAVSGHGNLKKFLLLCFKSCFSDTKNFKDFAYML